MLDNQDEGNDDESGQSNGHNGAYLGWIWAPACATKSLERSLVDPAPSLLMHKSDARRFYTCSTKNGGQSWFAEHEWEAYQKLVRSSYHSMIHVVGKFCKLQDRCQAPLLY